MLIMVCVYVVLCYVDNGLCLCSSVCYVDNGLCLCSSVCYARPLITVSPGSYEQVTNQILKFHVFSPKLRRLSN